MKMILDAEELKEVIKAHLSEKLGIPSESVDDIWFLDSDGDVVEVDASIEVDTTNAVPTGFGGPYRTAANPHLERK